MLFFNLPHSQRAVLNLGIAACVVAIDRAAQGETKRKARAWVMGGRKAGWSQGCSRRRAALHRTGVGKRSGMAWVRGCVVNSSRALECVRERRGERESSRAAW